MGKLWGNKVEEIANLKAEKEEIREELIKTKSELESLQSQLAVNTASKNKALTQINAVSTEYSKLLETSAIQEQVIAGLAEIKASNEVEIENLKRNLAFLQEEFGKSQASLKDSLKLQEDLRAEIRSGEEFRNLIEEENIRLRHQVQEKDKAIEVLAKAKDHCERHIAVLVKEKDRLARKVDLLPGKDKKVNPAKANENSLKQFESQSKVFEFSDDKSTSWGQVENQRLRVCIEQERKENQEKSAIIAKLEKENWNLLNRLRNKK